VRWVSLDVRHKRRSSQAAGEPVAFAQNYMNVGMAFDVITVPESRTHTMVSREGITEWRGTTIEAELTREFWRGHRHTGIDCSVKITPEDLPTLSNLIYRR